MIIGYKKSFDGTFQSIDKQLSLCNVLLVGGKIEDRNKYLINVIKETNQLPNHEIHIYDSTPDVLKEISEDTFTDILSYDQFERDFDKIQETIHEREKLLGFNKNYWKNISDDNYPPIITYVFNNFDESTKNLKRSSSYHRHLFFKELFGDIEQLYRLGILFVVALNHPDLYFFDFEMRIFLGSNDEGKTEELLFGEPYYLSMDSPTLLFSQKNHLPIELYRYPESQDSNRDTPIAKRKEHNNKIFIKEVIIKELFNNESFAVNFESQENISILYATNAFGKTTLFKLIFGLLSNASKKERIANFLYIFSTPFKNLKIFFNNNSSIFVERYESFPKLKISYFNKRKKAGDIVLHDNPYKLDEQTKNHFALLNEFVGFGSTIQFINANRLLDIDNYFHFLQDYFTFQGPEIKTGQLKYGEFKEAYELFAGDSPLRKLDSEIGSATININYYLRIMTEHPEAKYYISLEQYNKYEGMINSRFLAGNNRNNLAHFIVKDGDETQFSNSLSKNIDNLFELYLKFQKIKALFESFYDDFNPARKTIEREEGSTLLLTSDKNKLNINKLSTGEMNIIAVLSSLIFELTDDSILLIDEPEISLHVTWQIKLMKAITELVSERNNLQVIIATHSPFIGTNHNDSLAEVEIIDGD